ncbi:putative cohesin subunit rad21 [Calycina marina]|uniref:Cohesin subunit rad21 n=1 Tax=Calycina marina TaxID=1763456 RepID=A0A9P7Z0P7_9HELO|nr:putative cohesin subunit rad21 [Calycina marina]
MFYSPDLLSKTGPLARVWLSANLEKKLSKNHILAANVKDSVEAIATPNQAPMALRLSGQLLLGVVRIYSRKARYLLDDCNEALMKIKMAFRLSGNNDMPTGINMPSRDALMLPDVLTEGDNLEMPPLPDATFLLSQLNDDGHGLGRWGRAGSRDINLQEDLAEGQFLQSSIDNRGVFDEDVLAMDPDDIDLGLDFGDDLDGAAMTSKNDDSIEIGRDAPAARALEDDIFSDHGIPIPSKYNAPDDKDASLGLDFGGNDTVRMVDEEGDIDMFYMGDDVSALPAGPIIDRTRVITSPLSDIDDEVAQRVEEEHYRNLNSTALYEPEDETERSVFRNPAQRARRQKLLEADSQTTLTNAQIKEQQANRDKIIRTPSFLPRDPGLLALIEMQKNGRFVSNIMGDGRSNGWAPELQGMLSLATVKKTGELKRKRDSGIADMESDVEDGPRKSPRLELGEDETELPVTLGDGELGRDETEVAADVTIINMAGDDGFVMPQDPNSPGPNFDETTAPLVHPAESGPVSLGTQHAVHLLRDRFGSEAADNPEKRKKASVLFQDLLPEATTSKADATKMFFEILVLATKDAVKIEQQEALLGGPIRVRGKRGLWGAWAEREAGGEIAEENDLERGAAPVAAAA